jgi:pimeloyl-ACP methyl ester carboxylesterase
LVVWGDGDKILPRDAAERYVAAIPGAELVTLPNRGHMLECESPTDLADLISSFVANQE